MTTGGPNDQSGYGASGQAYGAEGHPAPPQPGYPTPPPAYGAQPGYPQPGYPSGPAGFGGFPPAPPTPGGPGQQASGFIPALFDYNFNSYVTPKVVKVLYILVTVMIAIGAVSIGLSGFAENPGFGVLTLIFGALFFIVVLALVRISLEFYVAVIKISEDVKELKSRN